MTELYTITLVGVTTPLTFTSLDIDIKVGNVLYRSTAITRSSIKEIVGVAVDDLTIEWNIKQTDYIPGSTLPIVQAMRNGAFDGATVAIDRLFSPDPWAYGMTISSDYVLKDRFVGLMDVDSVGMISASIKVASYTKLLNIKMPRNLYTANCSRTFYSSDCAVNRASLSTTGVVGPLSNTLEIVTGLSFPTDYYNLGVIAFTSGNNIGVRRSIRYSTNGKVQLLLPLPFSPLGGDQFTIYPGCDKTRRACARFNNSDNYRGFPYIPVPETALGAT